MIRVEIEPIDGVSSRVTWRATWGEAELSAGAGAIVCQAARLLLANGWASPADRLEAWRGDVLCLSGPLSAFAARTVRTSALGRPIFVKWRPDARS